MITKDREAPFGKEQLKSEDFWLFSTNLYGKSGVKNACLHLQDDHMADVNLILLCCWLDDKSIKLSCALFGELLETSTKWQQDTLHPARQQRRATDKKIPLYDTLLARELQLEKQEQKALLAVINDAPQNQISGASKEAQNIQYYSKMLSLPKVAIDVFIAAEATS